MSAERISTTTNYESENSIDSIESRLHITTLKKDSTSVADIVIEGLTSKNKWLPCGLFYDKTGSELFEKITGIPEYYLTSCETEILKQRAEEIAKSCAPNTVLIELGSGSSIKTRLLLEAFIRVHGNAHYVPIDICPEFLRESSRTLAEDYKELEVHGIISTYHQALHHIARDDKLMNKDKLICFLGSSIGNFGKQEAIEFLREISEIMNPRDKFLVGIDLKKDVKELIAAYDDAQGLTAEFNLNILKRINTEFSGHFDLNKFTHIAKWNETKGQIEMRIRSLTNQTVKIDALNLELQFKEGEEIHTETCSKYSFAEIDRLASAAGFEVTKIWRDSNAKFSLSIFSPRSTPPVTKEEMKQALEHAWKTSDKVFALLKPKTGSYLQKPIELRHPFIFYLGHLPAFAHNHVLRLTKKPSTNPKFDMIFERGIDPNVDDPTQCHPHSEVPDDWPSVNEVLAFRRSVREETLESIETILSKSTDIMALNGRVFLMVAEHDYMHAETLLYMYQTLDKAFKEIPSSDVINYCFTPSGVKNEMIEIPSGYAVLGAHFHEIRFGWCNEFPQTVVPVPAYKIDKLPVTNAEFLQFVESGEYENSKHWKAEDWNWKQKHNMSHPHCWVKEKCETSGELEWHFKTLFHTIPLSKVKEWPVYVSQAEASAYAAWKGKKLPSEAQIHRAAFGKSSCSFDSSIEENPFPWGEEKPIPGVHGNFGMFSWAPFPVGSFPSGKSELGVWDIFSDGWEWTCTPFEGFKGFDAYIPGYPGYSADFFDGKHYVLCGASFATAAPLIRKSFRNWYQAHYPYVFAKFRLVDDSN